MPAQETVEADDAELVRAAKADPKRFAEIFDRHFDAVYRFAYHQAGRDPHAAADAAQETFLRALRSLAGYEERGRPLRTWLYRIALNVLRDSARALRRGPPPPRPPPPAAPDDLAARLDGQSELQRVVVILKLVGGHTDRETAETLGRTEGAVKALYVRALRNLRERTKP
jgi:RNA polymerase sigma-70 factor (ECF subfamily)